MEFYELLGVCGVIAFYFFCLIVYRIVQHSLHEVAEQNKKHR